ncbi:hypothetical protein [Flavihumibacter fluvii]|uniref:hypothetical protein n=1 Tax=Flavihumibacter fluvii TaxID=2838157 RepID=UPI001BDE3C9B|nr:hypothetical protein [Flavihumibacter fluvii]ULQ51929.1 hypothetical protein KJS93_17710 [Flavihumibacter fluvii]
MPATYEFDKRRFETFIDAIIAILAAIPLAYVNTYIPFIIFLVIFGSQLLNKKWY